MVVSLRDASPHSALVVVCLMFWDLDRKIGPASGGALPPLGGVASKIHRSSPLPRFHHVLPPCSSCIWWLAKLPRSLGCSDTSPHGAESGPSPTSLRRKVYSHTHTLLNIYVCVCVFHASYYWPKLMMMEHHTTPFSLSLHFSAWPYTPAVVYGAGLYIFTVIYDAQSCVCM